MTTVLLAMFVAAAASQPGATAASHFQRAAAALAAGDFTAAEQGFQQVLKLEPNSIPALGNLGVTYARMERYADAVTTYRRALKLAPDQPGLLLNLGLAYLKQEDYPSAKPLFARLPRDARSRELQATCELFTGNPRQALELLNGLPRTPEVLFLSGTARLRLKQQAEARQDLQELLTAASPSQAHYLMGRAYADNEQFDEAVAEFRQALDLPAALLELAKSEISLRDNENAERHLREVLKASPAQPDANYYLGALLVLLAREEEAPPFLELARKARPQAWGAYYYLGRCLMQAGKAAEALPLLQKSAQLNAAEAAVWFQLARAYQSLNRKPEALAARAKYNALRESSLEKSQPVMPPAR